MGWVREKIKLPKTFKPKDRVKIAEVIIDHIITRSVSGIDKNNKKFPEYSDSYAEKKNVGPGDVDLVLSGEMLESIQLLSHKSGEIIIGFDKSDEELNGKAEGNILGSYGRQPNKNKARDFLGMPDDELDILFGAFEEEIELGNVETSEAASIDVGSILDELLGEYLE
jgi:hypothetical protein